MSEHVRYGVPKLFWVAPVILLLAGMLLDNPMVVSITFHRSHRYYALPSSHFVLFTFGAFAALFLTYGAVYAAYPFVLRRIPVRGVVVVQGWMTLGAIMCIVAGFVLMDHWSAASVLLGVGLLVIVAGFLLFVVNLFLSLFKGQRTA